MANQTAKYRKYDPIYGSTFSKYTFKGGISKVNPPKGLFHKGAIKFAADHRNKTGRPIEIWEQFFQTDGKEEWPVHKPFLAGRVIFSKEKYLPNFLGKDAPDQAMFLDAGRVSDSLQVLIYPNGAVVGNYMKKGQRDAFLKTAKYL